VTDPHSAPISYRIELRTPEQARRRQRRSLVKRTAVGLVLAGALIAPSPTTWFDDDGTPDSPSLSTLSSCRDSSAC
jgi:hypothetical protein